MQKCAKSWRRLREKFAKNFRNLERLSRKKVSALTWKVSVLTWKVSALTSSPPLHVSWGDLPLRDPPEGASTLLYEVYFLIFYLFFCMFFFICFLIYHSFCLLLSMAMLQVLSCSAVLKVGEMLNFVNTFLEVQIFKHVGMYISTTYKFGKQNLD